MRRIFHHRFLNPVALFYSVNRPHAARLQTAQNSDAVFEVAKMRIFPALLWEAVAVDLRHFLIKRKFLQQRVCPLLGRAPRIFINFHNDFSYSKSSIFHSSRHSTTGFSPSKRIGSHT